MLNLDWFELGRMAAGGIIAVIAALGGWKWLGEKINIWFDALARKTHIDFLTQVDDVLIGFAIDLYQSEIKQLKKSDSWNQDTGAAMLKRLTLLAKRHFGFETLRRLTDTGNSEEVDSLLRSRGELAVKRAKVLGKASKADPSKA